MWWLGVALAGAPDAVQVGDCALCHTHPDMAPAAQDESCAGCHAFLREVAADPARSARAAAVFPLWDRYVANLSSYLAVPDLGAASRLEPAAVQAWLGSPHDVRPAMPETMPRLNLSADQLQEIAAWLASSRPVIAAVSPPDPARVALGAQVYARAGCGGCHAFGSVDTIAELPAAPDLQYARHRMDPDVAFAWIQNPQRFSTGATMPALPLSDDDVLAVRDFVWLAEAEAPAWTVPELVATPSDASVTWAEVEAQVFGKICVHCHMDPTQNDGRAGPGNGGGFGWPASGVQLETHAGVVAAADRIPAALLRRRAEAARDDVPVGHRASAVAHGGKPGMPLGLPPLSDEDLSLVLRWIAQGMPE